MSGLGFARQRKAAVAVIFAVSALPVIGLLGLAVDFGVWNQSNATLSVAANVAAMTAVKMAANAQLAGDPNYATEGQVAGQQWFLAEIGNANAIGVKGVTGLPGATVQVTGGATLTATVTYNGAVPSIFGRIFDGIGQYPISGQAVAVVTSAPYLNVEMLLDNSSSMDIGATPKDMYNLQQISACDSSNAYYPNVNTPTGTGNQSYDPYNSFQYSGHGQTYQSFTDGNGTFKGPLALGPYNEPPVIINPPAPALPITVAPTSSGAASASGPSCTGFKAAYTKDANGNTVIPTAGPPCEFACHWDSSSNSGAAQDLYGAARRTLYPGGLNIQLRFDLLKIATNTILQAMQTDDLSIHNLKAGVFTFNTTLTQVYPSSGEAGDDWGAAEAAVGMPPTTPTQVESGILPVIGKRQNVANDDTDVVDAMNNLQSLYLKTASGDGTTSEKARKVLFLITDGFMDDNSRGRSAFPTTLCDGFKNLGYTIYVVYTPYYPIMHDFYLSTGGYTINGSSTQSGTLQYGLAQCASAPGDYISAADGPTLNAALAKFLKSALTQPARFSM